MSSNPGVMRGTPGCAGIKAGEQGARVNVHEGAQKSLSTTLWNLVLTMRPRQWVKNLLVFVAPAAAGVLTRQFDVWRSLATFGIWCAVASGIYLINDALDAEADRLHPDKRARPVASGALSRTLAITAGALLIVPGLVAAWFVAHSALVLVVGLYVVISIVYTIRLKREPVIELVAVASGFVLRAIAGGVATGVPLSSWFLAVASFGALFVVTGKRAGEHRRLGETRGQHRHVLALYTASFLRSTLTLTATVTVTAYCLWAFDKGGLQTHAGHQIIWIQLSVIPIILGILHILRLVDAGLIDAPEGLAFHDRLLQTLGVCWVALFSIGIYG
jgi:decaprenyl-phosphate phosphoribosyltransferase